MCLSASTLCSRSPGTTTHTRIEIQIRIWRASKIDIEERGKRWIWEKGNTFEEVLFPVGTIANDPRTDGEGEDDEGVVHPADVTHARPVVRLCSTNLIH